MCPGRGVQGRTGTGDPSADDDDIEVLGLHAVESPQARPGAKLGSIFG